MEESKIEASVRIYGSDYKIVSSDCEEYIQKIAFYVDRVMRELGANDKRLSTALVAVLASINIADERFKLAELNEELKSNLERYSKNFEDIKAINAKLEEENTALKSENERLKIDLAKAQTKLEGQRR